MTNEIIVILGKKGNGKTYMARHIIKDKRRLVIYDPQKEFSNCGVIVENIKELKTYLIANRRGNFRVVFQPSIPIFGDTNIVRQEFKSCCQIVSAFVDLYFMVDEIDKALPPRDEDNGFFDNMLARGRHGRISLVATTIRYTDIKRKFTAQADIMICFHMHEPSDVRYFQSSWGDIAKELPSLPPYHYIKYEEGIVSRHEPI